MFCKNKRWINCYVLLVVKQRFRGNIYSKNIRKKILYKVFGGGIYSKNSSIKGSFFFLYFLLIKVLDTKNESNTN